MSLPVELQGIVDRVVARTKTALAWPATKKIKTALSDNLADVQAFAAATDALIPDVQPPPPPPPPPVGTVLATPVVTAVGNVTLMLVLPQGKASTSLQLGSLPTQCDVKSRYSDGSIKTAILSAKATALGPLPVSEVSGTGGAFAPSWPMASMEFVIGGIPTCCVLPAPAQAQWLVGPVVQEARVRFAATPRLDVVFDVRDYADGTTRITATVENILDTAETTREVYDWKFVVNGSVLAYRQGFEHPAFMRWSVSTVIGGTLGAVQDDLEPFHKAGAIPRYIPTLTPVAYDFLPGALEQGGQGFEVLHTGYVSTNMGDTGGRADIGPYPDFVAQYVVHKTANAKDAILKHGQSAGSWPIHITNADHSSKNIDQTPDWCWRIPALGPLNGGVGTGFSTISHNPDVAHQPSLATIPYLLTGDRYYCDELAHWANFCLLAQPPAADSRNGSAGLLQGDQVRGIGWGLRQITDAAAWLPDSYPLKSYFAEKVQNNLANLDANATTTVFGAPSPTAGPYPFDITFGDGASMNPTDPKVLAVLGHTDCRMFLMASYWQEPYVMWAIHHARQLGFSGGLTCLTKMARQLLNVWTDSGYPAGHKAPYWPMFGYRKASDDSIVVATSLTQQHTWSEAWRGGSQDPQVSSGCPNYVDGGYGCQARLGLLIAQGLGLSGASESLAILMAYTSPYSGRSMIASLNGQGNFAVTS